jgi:hypothetical protein
MGCLRQEIQVATETQRIQFNRRGAETQRIWAACGREYRLPLRHREYKFNRRGAEAQRKYIFLCSIAFIRVVRFAARQNACASAPLLLIVFSLPQGKQTTMSGFYRKYSGVHFLQLANRMIQKVGKNMRIGPAYLVRIFQMFQHAAEFIFTVTFNYCFSFFFCFQVHAHT